MDCNENQYLDYIASLMKRGKVGEIQEFFSEPPEHKDETFVSYINSLIKKSKMSKAQIISSAGLSTDYMYKVLRGVKRTTERDYIIALCLSMKANVLETQRALELYPFPVLDSSDPRSAIILSAIKNGSDMYDLDAWLERLHLPLLKVSPDMPSVQIGPVRSTHSSENLINYETDEGKETPHQKEFQEFEITHIFKVAEHFGNAPFDFFYLAEFELTDADGKKVYAQANYWPDGQCAFGIAPATVEGDFEDREPDYMLESYCSLEGATSSRYFPYFLQLDTLTDKMAAEKMKEVNDTRTYGFRMSGHFSKHGLLMYSEAFNARHPELNEYLQVRQTETGYIYSVSRRSYYMQIELDGFLDNFYQVYFGKPDPQLYLLEVKSLDKLGNYKYYRSSFEAMVQQMELAAKQLTKLPDEQNLPEP